VELFLGHLGEIMYPGGPGGLTLKACCYSGVGKGKTPEGERERERWGRMRGEIPFYNQKGAGRQERKETIPQLESPPTSDLCDIYVYVYIYIHI